MSQPVIVPRQIEAAEAAVVLNDVVGVAADVLSLTALALLPDTRVHTDGPFCEVTLLLAQDPLHALVLSHASTGTKTGNGSGVNSKLTPEVD